MIQITLFQRFSWLFLNWMHSINHSEWDLFGNFASPNWRPFQMVEIFRLYLYLHLFGVFFFYNFLTSAISILISIGNYLDGYQFINVFYGFIFDKYLTYAHLHLHTTKNNPSCVLPRSKKWLVLESIAFENITFILVFQKTCIRIDNICQ